MQEVDVSVKICRYINEHFRPLYRSNRDFALTCGVDEKTIRLIQQEKYNFSTNLLKQICASQNIKMSVLFKSIDE